MHHHPRHLTTTLSLYVTVAVLLVLVAVGVYFELFLRANFLAVTSQRIQHGYERLGHNLVQIETSLHEGVRFARGDDRLLASIDFINQYQDKANYNTFLIDEEKKTLAGALLDRVKLSLNSDIALYGQDGELIAYATREGEIYALGYLTYAGGTGQIQRRQERFSEYQSGQLPQGGAINLVHAFIYPNEQLKKESVITYQNTNSRLSIGIHQGIFDTHSGKQIGHLEIIKNLDQNYFNQLSSEIDVDLSYAFEAHETAAATPFVHKGEALQLHIVESGNDYLAVAQKAIYQGFVLFKARVSRAAHAEIITTHRNRFLLLMLLVGGIVLVAMRAFINRQVSKPLAVLMQQIHEVEKGNYAQAPVVATGNELQSISASVNTLASVVNEREQSLERGRSEQEFLSNHDALTGLPNRRFFSQRLEHALNQARRHQSSLAVLFLDLDQFKLVNDTLGHDVGDALLIQVAQRLGRNVRTSDTLARIGGDEFNVLIESSRDLQELDTVLNKYLGLFKEPFTCGGIEIATTASIGVAIFPKDGADSTALLKHADLAVYRAKDSGRDRFSYFSEDLANQANERSETINALKSAMHAFEEFTMYYQPKVNARTGRVVSAEALIRWSRPGFGLVPPIRFIPIAEDTGLIIPLGDWIVGQVCRDLAFIKMQGIALEHMSLNVSNVQLRGHALITVLESAISSNSLNSSEIELEITESFIAKDMAQAILLLNEFRALGLQLAIDDFGTGYSSMSYLQKLPFTRMKVDKSFIDGVPHDSDSVSITRAILGLAKSFRLHVTAEGIERQDQLEFLRAQGCDEIQGYYFSKPLPLDAFLAYCTQNQSEAVGGLGHPVIALPNFESHTGIKKPPRP